MTVTLAAKTEAARLCKSAWRGGEAKHAFDLMAALKWSQSVGEEGRDDYASAVKWCFTGADNADNANQSWRAEIIKNVIRPLEMCREHFKTAAAPLTCY